LILYSACVFVSVLSSCLSFSCHAHHRDLHSFPTRRSSDLARVRLRSVRTVRQHPGVRPRDGCTSPCTGWRLAARVRRPDQREPEIGEHTSELQSRENLVCRLLLEKKNKQKRS